MSIAYIALGSNLDQPAQQVEKAIALISALPDTQLLSRSSLYLTTPVGYLDQPDFINAVAKIQTKLLPIDLLKELMRLESDFGRIRTFRNAPRVLDLDILLYDDVLSEVPELILPHPRMQERAFVMVPFTEIAPEQRIGVYGLAKDILAQLDLTGIKKQSSESLSV